MPAAFYNHGGLLGFILTFIASLFSKSLISISQAILSFIVIVQKHITPAHWQNDNCQIILNHSDVYCLILFAIWSSESFVLVATGSDRFKVRFSYWIIWIFQGKIWCYGTVNLAMKMPGICPFFCTPVFIETCFFTARLQVAGLRFEVGELTNTKISRISGVSNISSHLWNSCQLF